MRKNNNTQIRRTTRRRKRRTKEGEGREEDERMNEKTERKRFVFKCIIPRRARSSIPRCGSDTVKPKTGSCPHRSFIIPEETVSEQDLLHPSWYPHSPPPRPAHNPAPSLFRLLLCPLPIHLLPPSARCCHLPLPLPTRCTHPAPHSACCSVLQPRLPLPLSLIHISEPTRQS